MWSEVKSIDPGRGLVACLFAYATSGALTKVTGTNVTCASTGTGEVTFTFTGINIYQAEVPVIIPTMCLAVAAGFAIQVNAVTQTASTNTLTVVVTTYNSAGSAADLTAVNDKIGLIMSYRKAAV